MGYPKPATVTVDTFAQPNLLIVSSYYGSTLAVYTFAGSLYRRLVTPLSVGGSAVASNGLVFVIQDLANASLAVYSPFPNYAPLTVLALPGPTMCGELLYTTLTPQGEFLFCSDGAVFRLTCNATGFPSLAYVDNPSNPAAPVTTSQWAQAVGPPHPVTGDWPILTMATSYPPAMFLTLYRPSFNAAGTSVRFTSTANFTQTNSSLSLLRSVQSVFITNGGLFILSACNQLLFMWPNGSNALAPNTTLVPTDIGNIAVVEYDSCYMTATPDGSRIFVPETTNFSPAIEVYQGMSSNDSPPYIPSSAATCRPGSSDSSTGGSSTSMPPTLTPSSTIQAGASSASTPHTAATASLCLIMYGLDGNVDYPWSTATTIQVMYDPQPVTTAQGPAVALLSGVGHRTYTNRFGISVTTPLTLAAAGPAVGTNLLYLNSDVPVDTLGLTWNLSSAVQQPGSSPFLLTSLLTVSNVSGTVVERGSSRVDRYATSISASIPGFNNISIGSANINSLSTNPSACQALTTFTNGLRFPTQPSPSNGGNTVFFSYSISDGSSYSISTNLTLTTTSAFADSVDELGNHYQTVVNITGSRTYCHLPSNESIIAAVIGLHSSTPSQRFYPYSLLSSAPGVYTINTAPFLDAAGLQFSLSDAVPVNGASPNTGMLSTVISLFMLSTQDATLLVEGAHITLPLPSLQQQTYTFV